MGTSTDRIEKKILIRAPRSRVWRALTTPSELGKWFRVDLHGDSFTPGAEVAGKVLHPGYEHVTWRVWIERVEPERLFSWSWHPYAVEPGFDYSKEPRTLVVFELAEVPEGTMLTVVESGFDAIPAGRRAEAFRMNEGGWSAQMENVARHVLASL